MEEESKSIQDALKGVKIRNQKDLEFLSNFLRDQGFRGGRFEDWEMHKGKLEDIKNAANKLGVSDNFNLDPWNYKDYSLAEEEAVKHYSKYSSDDKIKEFARTFYIQTDDECSAPSNRCENKELIKWFEFRTKYGIKDIYKPWNRVTFYNLDKNLVKIYFGKDHGKNWEFKRCYKIIFGEDCAEFESPTEYSEKGTGIWQNLGKLEIKIYKNFSCDIKGEGLLKLKEIYFKYLNSQTSNIIRYNGKMTYTTPTKEN